MAGEVLVDALPYYDKGYEEPGIRDAVSFDLKKKDPPKKNNNKNARTLLPKNI